MQNPTLKQYLYYYQNSKSSVSNTFGITRFSQNYEQDKKSKIELILEDIKRLLLPYIPQKIYQKINIKFQQLKQLDRERLINQFDKNIQKSLQMSKSHKILTNHRKKQSNVKVCQYSQKNKENTNITQNSEQSYKQLNQSQIKLNISQTSSASDCQFEKINKASFKKQPQKKKQNNKSTTNLNVLQKSFDNFQPPELSKKVLFDYPEIQSIRNTQISKLSGSYFK